MASIAASAASVYSSPRGGNSICYVDRVKKKPESWSNQRTKREIEVKLQGQMYGRILTVSAELHQLGIWLLLFKLKVMRLAAEGFSMYLQGQEISPACRSPQDACKTETPAMQTTQLRQHCVGPGSHGCHSKYKPQPAVHWPHGERRLLGSDSVCHRIGPGTTCSPVIGKISYFTVFSLVSPSIMTASSTNLRLLTLCMFYKSWSRKCISGVHVGEKGKEKQNYWLQKLNEASPDLCGSLFRWNPPVINISASLARSRYRGSSWVPSYSPPSS